MAAHLAKPENISRTSCIRNHIRASWIKPESTWFFFFFHILYLFLSLANEREILHEHEHTNISTLRLHYYQCIARKHWTHTQTDRPNTFKTVICFAQSNSKIHMVIVSWGTSKECVLCVCVYIYTANIVTFTLTKCARHLHSIAINQQKYSLRNFHKNL